MSDEKEYKLRVRLGDESRENLIVKKCEEPYLTNLTISLSTVCIRLMKGFEKKVMEIACYEDASIQECLTTITRNPKYFYPYPSNLLNQNLICDELKLARVKIRIMR